MAAGRVAILAFSLPNTLKFGSMQSVLAVKKIVYNANKIWHYFGSVRMCWLCAFLVGSKQDLRPNIGIIWLPAKNFACILAFWQSAESGF